MLRGSAAVVVLHPVRSAAAGWLGAAAACCPVEGGWGVNLWVAKELQWWGRGGAGAAARASAGRPGAGGGGARRRGWGRRLATEGGGALEVEMRLGVLFFYHSWLCSR